MYHCVGFEYAEKYYVQAVPADWVKKKMFYCGHRRAKKRDNL